MVSGSDEHFGADYGCGAGAGVVGAGVVGAGVAGAGVAGVGAGVGAGAGAGSVGAGAGADMSDRIYLDRIAGGYCSAQFN